MEEKTTKQHVPTTDRDVTAVDGPKRPWTKPEIRIMKVDFTTGGPDPRIGEATSSSTYTPS